MLTDSRLAASAAWDAQSLNELKSKAGQDPGRTFAPWPARWKGCLYR